MGLQILILIKIGFPREGGEKDIIWIDGGIHAREWVAPTTAQYFIERVRVRE